MDERTINALLTLDTTIVDGVKVILIPYEDILRGKVSIRINSEENVSGLHIAEFPKTEKEAATPPPPITIPTEIFKLYPDAKKDKMYQDVVDYLKVIAQCWEYKHFGFKQSLLKKAAAKKPALNGVIFSVYGKDGDPYLTQLVQDNIQYIKQLWEESENK